MLSTLTSAWSLAPAASSQRPAQTTAVMLTEGWVGSVYIPTTHAATLVVILRESVFTEFCAAF